MTLRSFSLPLLALLLGACTATSLKSTWRSPDMQGPVGGVALLTVDKRGWLRQGFENRFAQELAKGGSKSITTFDLLSLPEIKQDKAAAAARFQSGGADSVLVVRLVDRSMSYHESRAGGERWAPVVGAPMGWYDYYSIGFVDMTPTYGTLRDVLYVESALFDLKTEKRIWAATTETVMKDDTDGLRQMDTIAAEVVAAMRKEGVLR